MNDSPCPGCAGPLMTSAAGPYCPRCAGRLLLDADGGDDDSSFPPAGGFRIGAFELGAELGRGAMGVVYRARQPGLGREVALKLILASRFAGDAARQRFLTEAETAAQLDHPNIVPVYEVGETLDGPYYAMKLVEGGTLAERITRTNTDRGESIIDIGQASIVISKIARAVHHAHQRGVLHRDLKPGNILIDPESEPHITDFGLSRRVGADSSLTMSGAPLGTPAYMAPEQVADGHRVTTAADIWSLGAMLYHLLAGRPPFAGTTAMDVLVQVRTQEAPRLRAVNVSVPADLETICLKCLERDPARRYSSAERLADDLERWRRHEPISARPVSTIERLRKWVRRRPAVAGLLALVVFAGLTAIGGIAWQWRRAEQHAQQARLRLHQMHLLNVQHSFDGGDPLGALPWLASALQDETCPSPQRATYEVSFANALRAAVVPERMWFLSGHASGVRVSADGQWVAAHSPTGDAMVWRIDTGRPLLPPGTLRGAWELAFSPEGRRIVIGDGLGATLYELPSGRPIKFLPHGGAVSRMTFSADSRQLATGSENNFARVWSADDGAPVTDLLAHVGIVSDVSLAPDGRLLTVDRGRSLIVWDAATGRELVRRDGGDFWRAGFNADGHRIIAADGQEARVYDGSTLEPVSDPMPHAGRVTLAIFSPDGTRVVTASHDGTARVWEVPSGRPVSPPMVHDLEVYAVAFSPDGRVVATGSQDMKARVWDAATGRALTPWLRHGGLVNSVQFTPDGRSLVTGSDDGAARLWRWNHPEENGIALIGQSAGLGWAWTSPDARTVLTRDDSGRVGLWASATGEPLAPSHHPEMEVRHARFSPEGRRVLLAGDNQVRLMSADAAAPSVAVLRDLPHPVQIEWHPDGQSFFTVSDDGCVGEWDAASGVRRREWPGTHPLTGLIDVTAEGRQLAAAAGSQIIRWRLGDPEPIISPALSTARLALVRFSRDGRLLAAGADDGTVGWLQVASNTWQAGPLPHPGWILDLDFSPDSHRVAVVANDGAVRLLDTRSGQLVGAPLRAPGGARLARFSPDGRLLGVASEFTCQVWDVATGGSVTPLFRFPRRLVGGLEFSADSRSALFVTGDARLIRQRLDAPDWPREQWQSAARLLSGHSVNEAGGLEVWLPESGTEQAWEQLRQRLEEMGLVEPTPRSGP